MATNIKDIQEKEFLQRISIRTMRKDLKQLREADTLREREKIGKIKVEKQPQIATPSPIQEQPFFESKIRIGHFDGNEGTLQERINKADIFGPKPANANVIDDTKEPVNDQLVSDAIQESSPVQSKEPLSKSEGLEKILEPDVRTPKMPEQAPPEPKESKVSIQEVPKVSIQEVPQASRENLAKSGKFVRPYANEGEKEEIFLLESERRNLESQLKSLAHHRESPLSSEKGRISSAQKKLADIESAEQENEVQEKAIIQAIANAKTPAEKHRLEQKKWKLEEQHQHIERSRWPIETELAQNQQKVKTSDQGDKEVHDQEDDLKQQIASIDESLRNIYATISQRESTKVKVQPLQKNVTPLEQKAHPKSFSRNSQSMQGLPQTTRDKIAKSTDIEERQRMKFMEEVEKWASMSGNNQDNET